MRPKAECAIVYDVYEVVRKDKRRNIICDSIAHEDKRRNIILRRKHFTKVI